MRLIKNEQVIKQLESIRSHCNEMSESNILDGEPDEFNIWLHDVRALDIAIKKLKKEAPRDWHPLRAIKKTFNKIISHRRK